MPRDIRMLGKSDRRVSRMRQMISVHAVHDVDVVAEISQRVSEPVNLHRIAAEAVRRIKRSEMQEIQSPVHRAPTLWITSIIWRAAWSHVKPAGGGAPGFAHVPAHFFARKAPAQRAGDFVLARVDIDAAASEQSGKRTGLRRDHRAAASRRFDGRQSEAFHQRRQHQHRRQIQKNHYIFISRDTR